MSESRHREYDAFISYRRAHGADVARLVKAELRQRGTEAFLDVDDLPAGHFDEALLGQIARAPNFILILSPACLDACSDTGDWLRKEIRCALDSQRNVVPVRMPAFRFPGALPADIRAIRRHQSVGYGLEAGMGLLISGETNTDYRVEIVRKGRRDIGYVPKSLVVLLDPEKWFKVRSATVEGWILSRYVVEC